jgi:hypothetical protein
LSAQPSPGDPNDSYPFESIENSGFLEKVISHYLYDSNFPARVICSIQKGNEECHEVKGNKLAAVLGHK